MPTSRMTHQETPETYRAHRGNQKNPPGEPKLRPEDPREDQRKNPHPQLQAAKKRPLQR